MNDFSALQPATQQVLVSLPQQYAAITLIRLPQNSGKGAAVKSGLGELQPVRERRVRDVRRVLVQLGLAVQPFLKDARPFIVDAPPRYARFEMPEGGSTFSNEKVEGLTGGDWPEIWF